VTWTVFLHSPFRFRLARNLYRYWHSYPERSLLFGIAEIELQGLWVHSLRATAATNALENAADIAKVQEWLGQANMATTRLYDRRKTRPEDSLTFRVKY
jgi:integrase